MTIIRRLRPTPRQPSDEIPEGVRAWFARERDGVPWEAVLPETVGRIPGWWRAWHREHPGSSPPAGAQWIQWPRGQRRETGKTEG